MARAPWISLALVAVAASLTSRIDTVYAAGEDVKAAIAKPAAEETRVGTAIASDLAQQQRAVERTRRLDMQGALLTAAEKRIDDKLQQLNSERRPVRALDRPVRRVSATAPAEPGPEPADDRIAALVKMYQSMRPKDAARIFERLDMNVQVDVASHMRERAAAAIMAEMDPKAASALTMALAGQPMRTAAVDIGETL